jgi:hypothetical protein
MLLAPLAKHNFTLAQGDVNSAPNKAIARDAGDLERRVTAVYDHVNAAVVRVQWTDGKISGGSSGVIVTADGHVLLSDFPANAKLTFNLPDGCHATGSTLGWYPGPCSAWIG